MPYTAWAVIAVGQSTDCDPGRHVEILGPSSLHERWRDHDIGADPTFC